MGFVSEQFKETPAQIAQLDKKQASDSPSAHDWALWKKVE